MSFSFEMLMALLIFLLVIVLSMRLDKSIYHLNKNGQQEKNKGPNPYVPNLKIWGIGLIVGLVIFISPILYKIIESLFIKHPEYRTDLCLRWPVWPYVVQIFGLLFIFGIFALVITAIIRIAKED